MSAIKEGGNDVFKNIGRRRFASRKRKAAALLAFVLAGVIAAGAYAFTASNEIKEQAAGAGTVEVTGYKNTKDVSYTWNGAGTEMEAVNFVLEGKEKPSDVKVALSKAEEPVESEWVDCAESGGEIKELTATTFEVSCHFKVPNAEGDHLSVAAVSEGKVIIQ